MLYLCVFVLWPVCVCKHLWEVCFSTVALVLIHTADGMNWGKTVRAVLESKSLLGSVLIAMTPFLPLLHVDTERRNTSSQLFLSKDGVQSGQTCRKGCFIPKWRAGGGLKSKFTCFLLESDWKNIYKCFNLKSTKNKFWFHPIKRLHPLVHALFYCRCSWSNVFVSGLSAHVWNLWSALYSLKADVFTLPGSNPWSEGGL